MGPPTGGYGMRQMGPQTHGRPQYPGYTHSTDPSAGMYGMPDQQQHQQQQAGDMMGGWGQHQAYPGMHRGYSQMQQPNAYRQQQHMGYGPQVILNKIFITIFQGLQSPSKEYFCFYGR